MPVPVSSLIRPAGKQGRGFVRRVLAAVDRVHRVTNVPALSVDVVPMKSGRRHGQFDGQRILVNRTSAARELALVHEIGHVLDYFAIGDDERAYASDAGAPILDGWRRAAEASSSVRRLREVRAAWPPVEPELVAYVDYLLRPSEMLARSYAQWIADTADDGVLMEQVIRSAGTAPAIAGLVQWESSEFAPIRVEFERLMERLRWTP
jgi:hypothetical protein